MGRIFTCLAIVCAMVYGAPTYGAECYESQNQTYGDCMVNFAQAHRYAEDIPCQWMWSKNGYLASDGFCTKPCHRRSNKSECENYGGDAKHNFCIWSNNGLCIPNCGDIVRSDNCDSTIGCIYDESRKQCGRCPTGKYYESKKEQKTIQVDTEDWYINYPGIWVVVRGECVSCATLPSGGEWVGMEVALGACPFLIKCPAGFGKVDPYAEKIECGSCLPGKTSQEQEIKFIPNGDRSVKIDICNDDCPAGYYCDGEHGQQPCPKAEKATVGMTSKKGAISKEQCYITKDTEFCDRHGCFSLPLGNATLTYWKSTK